MHGLVSHGYLCQDLTHVDAMLGGITDTGECSSPCFQGASCKKGACCKIIKSVPTAINQRLYIRPSNNAGGRVGVHLSAWFIADRSLHFSEMQGILKPVNVHWYFDKCDSVSNPHVKLCGACFSVFTVTNREECDCSRVCIYKIDGVVSTCWSTECGFDDGLDGIRQSTRM
jgi:hypothetical protein